MRKICFSAAFFLMGLMFSACVEDELSTTGIVKYISLEGGFYGIIGNDGNHYDPINLEEEFREDGLSVTFDFIERDDLSSVHMWGKIIEITSIKKIE